MSLPDGKVSQKLFVMALLAAVIVWVFSDALLGSGVLAFRDAGHFYYPLFQFVQSEWASGRVPLWNPYENLGMPLAGNAAASVFYPGKLVFWLPLDYARVYNLYIVGHLALAAWGAYSLARRWGASVPASGVAALSYALSGNVLFQHTNVIFLVGAAWLPLAVWAADRMLTQRSWRGALGLGAVLALMTLGGNVEMAYHAGLMAVTYALWLGWPARRRSEGRPAGGPGTSRAALLALAAAVALGLAAVQVFPSVVFTRQSGRRVTPVARTVYELPGRLAGEDLAGRHWWDGLLCRRIDPGTHHEHVYHFSVGPWRLAEYVWPNASGRQFPVHRRWLEAVPAEGRLWVPSLYMGVVPLVLAVSAMRLGRADARTSWLSWTVVFSLAASFGWFGPGWLIEEIRQAMGGNRGPSPWVGPPFGGLYWLMTVFLPGYIYFRYPAKLLVITALGLSLLAAAGWDRVWGRRPRRLGWALAGLILASFTGAVAGIATRPEWPAWLARVGPDVLFGPLDAGGANDDLIGAFLQTAVVLSLFGVLLRRAVRFPASSGAAVLALVAGDLVWANGWMVACVPKRVWDGPPAAASAIERAPGAGLIRVARYPVWLPPRWQRVGSAERIAESVDWDRQTLWPKHHLRSRVRVVGVTGTMMPYDYEVFLAAVRRLGLPPGAASGEGVAGLLAEYLVLPGGSRVRDGRQLELPRPVEDVSLWRHPHHLPRAWIVHDVEVLPPLASVSPRGVWERTVYAVARDLGRSALVETTAGLDAGERGGEGRRPAGGREAPAERGGAEPPERCRVVRDSPQRVELDVVLRRPGLVVLADQFSPGWQLEVRTGDGLRQRWPVVRTNRVMRGAWLPAGRHRLTYRYRPAEVLWGAVLSALSGLAVAAAWLVGRRAG